MTTNDRELSVLTSIRDTSRENSRVTQRELAAKAGLSLGMVNALLKHLSEKGLISLTKLSSRSVRYALTRRGMSEIIRRSADSLKRAAMDADRYRDRLEAFILEAKSAGAGTIVLSGRSDLDFILESLCELHGMVFVRSIDAERARNLSRRAGVVLLLAERSESGGECASVSDILVGAK